jgi:hypothetical protein
MIETLEQWADDHCETVGEYKIADAESDRIAALKQKKTWELLHEYADVKLLTHLTGANNPEELRERVIEGIIDLNLDLE